MMLMREFVTLLPSLFLIYCYCIPSFFILLIHCASSSSPSSLSMPTDAMTAMHTKSAAASAVSAAVIVTEKDASSRYPNKMKDRISSDNIRCSRRPASGSTDSSSSFTESSSSLSSASATSASKNSSSSTDASDRKNSREIRGTTPTAASTAFPEKEQKDEDDDAVHIKDPYPMPIPLHHNPSIGHQTLTGSTAAVVVQSFASVVAAAAGVPKGDTDQKQQSSCLSGATGAADLQQQFSTSGHTGSQGKQTTDPPIPEKVAAKQETDADLGSPSSGSVYTDTKHQESSSSSNYSHSSKSSSSHLKLQEYQQHDHRQVSHQVKSMHPILVNEIEAKVNDLLPHVLLLPPPSSSLSSSSPPEQLPSSRLKPGVNYEDELPLQQQGDAGVKYPEPDPLVYIQNLVPHHQQHPASPASSAGRTTTAGHLHERTQAHDDEEEGNREQAGAGDDELHEQHGHTGKSSSGSSAGEGSHPLVGHKRSGYHEKAELLLMHHMIPLPEHEDSNLIPDHGNDDDEEDHSQNKKRQQRKFPHKLNVLDDILEKLDLKSKQMYNKIAHPENDGKQPFKHDRQPHYGHGKEDGDRPSNREEDYGFGQKDAGMTSKVRLTRTSGRGITGLMRLLPSPALPPLPLPISLPLHHQKYRYDKHGDRLSNQEQQKQQYYYGHEHEVSSGVDSGGKDDDGGGGGGEAAAGGDGRENDEHHETAAYRPDHRHDYQKSNIGSGYHHEPEARRSRRLNKEKMKGTRQGEEENASIRRKEDAGEQNDLKSEKNHFWKELVPVQDHETTDNLIPDIPVDVVVLPVSKVRAAILSRSVMGFKSRKRRRKRSERR